MRLILVLSLFANLFFIDKASANFFFHTVGVVSGPDLIPDAVNWTNITRPDPCAAPVEGNSQTITGISAPIDLDIENTGVNVEYQLNGGGWISLVNSGTTNIIGVASGTTLKFRSATGGSNSTVTIKNVSNGNAVLDTFTIALLVPFCI